MTNNGKDLVDICTKCNTEGHSTINCPSTELVKYTKKKTTSIFYQINRPCLIETIQRPKLYCNLKKTQSNNSKS